MPWYVSDAIFYLAVLTSAYCAYHNIPDTLNHIRNLAACPEQTGPGPQKQLQKDAENAISIDTLRILSEGHSYDLRASTIKIVASRTVKTRTKKLLLKDLASKDEDRRYNAISALWMLLYNPALHGKHVAGNFVDYNSFHALITALRNVLADHHPKQSTRLLTPGHPLYPEPDIPPSPISPPVRPYHETCLMMILRVLLDTSRPYDQHSEYPDNITCALSAGLVTRWLKDYPFPCSLPHNSRYNFKKSDVVSLFERRAWASDDLFMAGFIDEVNSTKMGKKQLKDAGLLRLVHAETYGIESVVGRWKNFPSRLNAVDTDRDVRMTNGESTAGAATPPPVALDRRWEMLDREAARTRPHELSREEESLRRRRREAVVIAEPGAPLSQDNILQRTESGSAWHQHVAEETLAHTADAADPTNIDHPLEQGASPVTEEAFERLLLPLIAEQRAIEGIRTVTLDNPDFDPNDVRRAVQVFTSRVNTHENTITTTINQWHLPHEERLGLMDRLHRYVHHVLSDPGTIDLLRMADDRIRES